MALRDSSLLSVEINFEDDIRRNPYHLKTWISFLDFKKDATPPERYVIFERALKFLPRSYKLWHAYLMERTQRLEKSRVTDKRLAILVNIYERALVHLHKMPRIWLDYCDLLMSMLKGTETRHTFDRALQALPITQHKPLWELYISWVKDFGVPETAVRVYRRYLMFEPSRREEYVNYLEEIGQYGEAARQIAACLDDDNFVSPSGQTRHQMWMHLCDICATHPEEGSSTLMNVDAIIRSGISKFSDEVGRLWCRLADYYIRLGQFERARDIYEEAINSVTTVRDFTIVFDAYIKVEESVTTAKLQMIESEDGNDEGGTDAETESLRAEVEMGLARLEHLMEKRPFLLSSVILRQNPHNVREWQKRIGLYKGDRKKVLMTYVEAVNTINPKLATGKLSKLWLSFARYYENSNDLENARVILSKATEVNFKSVDELANVWCAWGEMEIKYQHYEEALSVMQQAVMEPTSSMKKRKAAASAAAAGEGVGEENADGGVVVNDLVHKNVKVWGLYLDLEESLGTVETCRAAYDRAIKLKVVTAQMTLNYASYLEEHNYFEDSFRVYEQAVTIFTYLQAKKIWMTYLDKFIERYQGSKLERLRDLFEQALAKAPNDVAAEIYIKYGKAEEAFGLIRHALSVYDRATRAVPEACRLDFYRLYIKKVEQALGVTKTRPIYERAIGELNDDMCRAICLDYADMESKLGEIDRARAILQHGSQFANPRREQAYWGQWREFEEMHGNEDTFRDMLRVQRSVEIAYSQNNYLAEEMMAQVGADGTVSGFVPSTIDQLARQAEEAATATANKRKFEGEDRTTQKRKGRTTNSEEIDIDDAGDEEDNVNEEQGMGITQRPVPQAVFGSL